MKVYVYLYSNGNKKEHKNLIKNKTILKEANGADRVSIYKCNEYEVEKIIYNNILAGQYITTLLLN